MANRTAVQPRWRPARGWPSPGERAASDREIQTLLHRRLRLSALVFASGFASFLVIHALQVDYHSPFEVFLLGFHAAVAVVLSVLAGLLFRRSMPSLGWLRVAEVIVFGLPGMFFVAFQYFSALECCRQGFFDIDAGAWLVLMFCYALFIPNTFRRAALVIGAMGMVPVLLLYAMFWLNPHVNALATVYDLTGFTLVMVISSMASLLGSTRSACCAGGVRGATGQYRLKHQIGGGMGEVSIWPSTSGSRPCVVKLIRPDKAGDPGIWPGFSGKSGQRPGCRTGTRWG